jgi:thioredoxin reductase (NADPH)
MGLPVLVAVDEDRDALADVETQLIRRYSHDYRVECLGAPGEALRMLTELAHAGEEVALVLAGNSRSSTAGSELLEQVRQLHPHAKRALLVPWDTWADQSTAEAIRGSLALGHIDHYVPRPGRSPDEVFHEAVSSFLLEWARERRLVPQTVHIVGETWSGRAYELREVFEQCAVPHTFSLADSDEGRELLAGAGADCFLTAGS